MEQLINEVAEEAKDTELTISNSYIGMDKNTIECLVQYWEMINVTFAEEVRREKKIASLGGASIGGEHTVFPHIHETFYSARVQHNDIRPIEAVVLKDFEKMSVNAIEGIDVKLEDVKAMVRQMSSEMAPRNWTATNILTIFHLSQ